MWSPDVESLPYAEVKVPPSYPQAAIARAVDGTVQVQALVGRDGAVHDAFILHSIPGLNDAALDAVWQWRFRPARDHGEPLAVWVVIPVRFALH
ncbi:MAG: energy transducer TonB [Candidatus Eisenbacteria bacterium]|uniref:Energy transducer TonB n=1 Tax=Eiseniibacteriota bacterium TaxID=2212470 RepID=A0A9D6QJ24_UNCEI|nr:energy transducer TonB [Candidatus Eisenbacteria bacterium]